jgi:hypothetical protein
MYKHWKLTKEQYEKLLSYIGCGDFENAKLIIFGNEEGTGGNSIQANIEARTALFGKNSEGSLTYCVDPTDQYQGFWEISGVEGGEKIKKYSIENLLPYENGDYTKGSFLSTVARICLGIEENHDEGIFEPYGENVQTKEKVKEFIINGLFQPRNGLNTFLSDWSPLPRPNQNWWGSEYENVFNKEMEEKNLYLEAFHNVKKTKKVVFQNEFSNFSEDVKRRLILLKNVFTNSPAQVILGLGGVVYKKQIFEEMFCGVKFENIITNEEIDSKALVARVSLETKDLYIFLLPFPIAGTVFKDGEQLLTFFKEVTFSYLKPILSDGEVLINKPKKTEVTKIGIEKEVQNLPLFIRNKEDVDISQIMMKQKLLDYPGARKLENITLIYPGGKLHNREIIFIPKFDIWYHSTVVEEDRKIWNAFGLGKPNSKNEINALIEVNLPYPDSSPQGNLILQDNKLYLTHKGTMIGKLRGDIIKEQYKGTWLDVGNRKVILVGELTSQEFPVQLAHFIKCIDDLKKEVL